MPDSIGETEVTTGAAAPEESDGLFQALSGMLDFRHPENPQAARLSSDEEPPAATTTATPANSATSGPDALAASLELDGDPKPDPAPPEATDAPAAATTDDSPTEGEPVAAEGDQPADEPVEAPEGDASDDAPAEKLSRKERGARISQLEAERDELKRKLEASTPQRSAEDDQKARASVLEFIGMKAGEGDEQAEYLALDQKAKTTGFQYEDEQLRYKELTERHGMVGTLYGVARDVAWEEMAADLADEELGLGIESVREAGSVQAWKQRYRTAVEEQLGSRVTQTQSEAQASLEVLRTEMGAEIADLKQKLAEAERSITEQAAAHQSTLQRARTLPRAPFGGGNAAGAGGSSPANVRGAPMSDLVSALSASLQESAEGRT
jgi:hypothetical protein